MDLGDTKSCVLKGFMVLRLMELGGFSLGDGITAPKNVPWDSSIVPDVCQQPEGAVGERIRAWAGLEGP